MAVVMDDCSGVDPFPQPLEKSLIAEIFTPQGTEKDTGFDQ
jgi:hypothetical protein